MSLLMISCLCSKRWTLMYFMALQVKVFDTTTWQLLFEYDTGGTVTGLSVLGLDLAIAIGDGRNKGLGLLQNE